MPAVAVWLHFGENMVLQESRVSSYRNQMRLATVTLLSSAKKRGMYNVVAARWCGEG